MNAVFRKSYNRKEDNFLYVNSRNCKKKAFFVQSSVFEKNQIWIFVKHACTWLATIRFIHPLLLYKELFLSGTLISEIICMCIYSINIF